MNVSGTLYVGSDATESPSRAGMTLSDREWGCSCRRGNWSGFVGSRYLESFESTQMSPFKFSLLHLFLSVLNL